MPFPYSIICGRETAMPSPLYYSGVTEINIIHPSPFSFSVLSAFSAVKSFR